MAQKSAPIRMYDPNKLERINAETKTYWKKYQIDMELRELSEKTISGYLNDLQSWWIYIYDNQNNKSVIEINEDDITEFLYWCKKQGNNSRRIKRRMSSIAAFYKYLRKKRIVSENPMEFIDRPKKDTDVVEQTFLTIEQVEDMRSKLNGQVESAKTTHSKHIALMMRLYAFLSLSTMARVNAISNIKWDQIEWEDRLINNVLEKEGYVVTLYFSAEVLGYLRDLLNFRQLHKIQDNMLAGYCDAEGVRDDSSKIQAIIQITQLHLQCRKIDKVINEELMLKMPNETKLRALSDTKGKFLNSISTIVKDNGLSANYNDNNRAGKNTLSMKMKEIAEIGFEQIRTNLFDIHTAEAMRQVADISNRSILDQLSLDDSDYVDMIKEQREMLQSKMEQCEELEEENRCLKNKIAELESYKIKKR